MQRYSFATSYKIVNFQYYLAQGITLNLILALLLFALHTTNDLITITLLLLFYNFQLQSFT